MAQQDELLSHNYDFKLQREMVCFMPTGYAVRPIQCMESVNKQAMYKCQTEQCQRSGGIRFNVLLRSCYLYCAVILWLSQDNESALFHPDFFFFPFAQLSNHAA